MKEIDYWLYSIWSLCGSMILISWIVHWTHVCKLISRLLNLEILIEILLLDHTTSKVSQDCHHL